MNEVAKNLTCWACNKEIHVGQKICLECNQWQGWRRYFHDLSTPLSLLVALIAVITTFASVTDKAFTNPTVSLGLTGTSKFVVENGNDYVQLDLAVKNYGEVDAAIEPRMECVTALSPIPLNAQGNYSIEAGKSSEIAFISPAIKKDRVAAFSCIAYYLSSSGERVKRVDILFIPGQAAMFAQ
jgi:hypothetical protein